MTEDRGVKTVTKRQIQTLNDDDINTEALEVSIIQYQDSSGATIEFGDKLRLDDQDLIELSRLVSFLTK
jgi:hypothetical protein